MSAKPFPVERWQPLRALGELFCGPCGRASLTIELAPYELNGEEVDSPLRLDQIDLPVDELFELAGRTFEFPLNPEEGFIDGSVYLRTRHHTVDVLQLAFGAEEAGELPLKVTGCIAPEPCSLDYAETDFVLETRLILPWRETDLPVVAKAAIAACGASKPADAGRVMASLKDDPRGCEWRAELHRLIREQLAHG